MGLATWALPVQTARAVKPMRNEAKSQVLDMVSIAHGLKALDKTAEASLFWEALVQAASMCSQKLHRDLLFKIENLREVETTPFSRKRMILGISRENMT